MVVFSSPQRADIVRRPHPMVIRYTPVGPHTAYSSTLAPTLCITGSLIGSSQPRASAWSLSSSSPSSDSKYFLLPSHSPPFVFMSSTDQTSPPSDFQLIINAALGEYADITGIEDLTKIPFAEKIESLNSPEAILELLQERENAFKEYREGNRRLISCLSPGVKILHAFSRIAGPAVSMVSVTVTYKPMNLLTVATTRSRSHRQRLQRLSLPESMSCSLYVPRTSFSQVLSDVRLCQAVNGVTSSYDAVLELFECLGKFLTRLEIYLTIPATTMMTDVIIKIMVELLSVLALATKQIRQGRFSKCAFIYKFPL